MSFHARVLRSLAASRCEVAALVARALNEEEQLRGELPPITNGYIAFACSSLEDMSPDEFTEQIDRLVARGYMVRTPEGRTHVNEHALRIVERGQLPPRVIMKLNAQLVHAQNAPPISGLPA